MQLETARPILGINLAERQADTQPQVRRPARQAGERVTVRRCLEVGAAELVGHVQLLHGGSERGNATQILETTAALRVANKRPEIGQFVGRDAAALVADADDDLFRCLADCDLDGWWRCDAETLGRLALLPLDDGLDRVAEEFPDDVFKVAEYVRKVGV